MQFVQNGQDEYVKGFLAEIVSSRKLKEYVTKIISYLKSIDDLERCDKYITIQDEINSNWLGKIRMVADEQKTTEDKLKLCAQGDNKEDRAYLASSITCVTNNRVNEDDSDNEEELYDQYRENAVCLKYALGQDPTNSDILEGLIINLWSVCEYEEVLRICKKSKVNDRAKSEILDRMLDMEDYPREFGERCIQEILRLNPSHPYGNIDHDEDDTMLSGAYSLEHDS